MSKLNFFVIIGILVIFIFTFTVIRSADIILYNIMISK